MNMSKRVVIVGAGHAAGQVIATLRQKKFEDSICLIGQEGYLPYQRPPLSKKYLAGELPPDRLHFKADSFYDVPNIEVHLNTTIDIIDRDRKTVHADDASEYSYDKLVLSLGAHARHIDLPGVELPGVHYLRTIADVDSIHERFSAGKRLVIVGAGYIGLEVAAVAAQAGLDVSVVEMLDRVMSRVVSEQVSEFYQKEHTDHGVKLLLKTGIKGFSGDGRVQAADLSDGTQLPADLVIIGIGIVPNTELATEAGLEVSNGIVVDDRCRTSDPDIFAVGDCTFHPNEVLGRNLRLESVHNALEQAKTAAANICGEDVRYAQVPWFWSDQYDLKLQIAGLSQNYDQTIIRGNPDDRSFSCVYLREGVLIAVDAVNKPKDFMQSKKLIAEHIVIEPALLADANVELKDMIQSDA
jgi:3-phenylpropionate/trans-cinnamate dioxygenase ferredoxin reductase subunit